MAGGDGSLRVRTLTEEEIVKGILFRHYKKCKVEISKAIIKPFPFLEGLRDRELITNKMYEDCQSSCRNLVPIHNVAYVVLEALEKTFDMEVLEALFSPVNMQEYPELAHIHESFSDELKKKMNSQEGDGEEMDERPNNHLGIEQESGESSHLRSLPWSLLRRSPVPSPSDGSTRLENELAECDSDTQQTDGRQTNAIYDQNDEADSQEVLRQYAQESPLAESHKQEAVWLEHGETSWQPPSPLPCQEEAVQLPYHETKMSSCSVLLMDIKKEKPFTYVGAKEPALSTTRPDQASDVIEISSEDSKGASDEDELVETSPRSKPAISNCSPIASASPEREDAQEATCSQYQLEPESIDFGTSAMFRKRLGKRVRGFDDSSAESSEDELPPASWILAPTREREETDSMAIGKASTWRINNRKRYAMDVGNTSTLAKDSRKRKKVRKQIHQVKPAQRVKRCKYGNYFIQNIRIPKTGCSLKGRKETNEKPLRKGRKRGPRIPREENVNFFSPELAVTCGDAKGILHQKKFKESISVRSIRSEDGRWFTPREFEIEGKFEASKNWRLSVRCHGWPLKELIKKGVLPNPPRKRKQQNAWSHNQTLIDSYVSTDSNLSPGVARAFSVCLACAMAAFFPGAGSFPTWRALLHAWSREDSSAL
ncbi:nuclear autoantigen Sp-100 isoform X3 [Perognathus longimembris pacificus]|uniref:nuclear autoantigen Sp-100 isoform X3 n=1 Tax=Perognathus longimembris pacificus TaxID=214514 RepID=UPI002018FABA|nr:nuclear autoantigen Sp-100 isoform X3 [Perognathus longimembris pacificus]